ncbi:M23 family metallopeptidase [Frigoribacterium sp. CFBP9030]|uniref:M23 family metallopeptidase n=1 Tax=Frigoribacterium sp. CFBP9030 TaxID=3096537 RepID=UPI002A6A5FD7|nr:M23 family metallopeptidase [Frigoribacterium sp. CFBP9030]MDY0891800.1 M23 family metallopeptidase [Frigoribacterium sp. CFBP9030]
MSDPRHDAPPLTRREALARERAAAAAPEARVHTDVSAAASEAPAAHVPAAQAPAPQTAPVAQAPVAQAPAAQAPAPQDAPVAQAPAAQHPAARRQLAVARVPMRSTRIVSGSEPRLLPSRRPSFLARRAREAAVPAFALLAATLFFSSNVTPASASDLGGSGIPVSTAAPMTGQTMAASLVVLAVAERDSYGVTDPPPPPPPPPVVKAPVVSDSGSSSRSSSSDAVVGAAGGVASGGGTVVNSGAGDIRWPFPGSVVLSSGFGPRSAPCAACSSMHMGLDMTPGGGTPIGAVAAGTVRTAGVHAQFGTYVVIDHVIDGGLVSTMYAHMRSGSSPMYVGQQVGVGELVGTVGRTGVATGEHLHFEVLMGGSTQIDPKAWLDANAGRTL